MIEIHMLGTTSYGGKVYALEADKPYEIPALRCTMLTSKINNKEVSLEEAIKYFNKNQSESKNIVAKFYRRRDASIGEMGREAIYLKDVSRLFSFVSWMPVGAPRGIQGTGTEKSLNSMKSISFVDNNNKRLRRLCEDVERYLQQSCQTLS